ncbi:MAG TPA: patatin-like phospholipase family protein [Candidatus Competibacteraceae bacterium]|nr:patatin-like phospholipase family protein [Candidatus Competibacteraceae bacterium]
MERAPALCPRLGLILTGGGARAAYQVGVLKAIAEALPRGAPLPFPVLCGTSAGAINAAALACRADDFGAAVAQLERVWSSFHAGRVFRTGPWRALTSGLRWGLTLLAGGRGWLAPRALLDNRPLRELLARELRLQNIQRWIDAGYLHALSITAASYYSGQSVTFYQGRDSIRPWTRSRRIGIPRPITLDHLMASSAIPLIFPSVRIGFDYYGDGSMRQLAPLSAALHLGAERLLVIGVRNEAIDHPLRQLPSYPSFGQIAGYVLDTLFMDSLYMDVERLKRINHTLHYIDPEHRDEVALRPVELEWLFPSQDVRLLAEPYVHELPRSVRWLLKRLGALNRGGRPLINYLLFEAGFCRALIELGYHDAQRRLPKLLRLLRAPAGVEAE